jgi:hypothetical protein
MTAVTSSNNIRTRDNRAPAPAVRDDGTNFPWRMFFQNNQRIVDADLLEECLDYLIPDYTLLSPEERSEARVVLTRQVQQLARAQIVSNVTPEQAEELEDWEWEILNYGEGDTQDPQGWGDGTRPIGGEQDDENPDFWKADQPLVLLDISYTPYTEILPPLSSEGDYKEVKNLIWLRPTGELELLRSLSRIGYITFGSPSAVVADEIARKN